MDDQTTFSPLELLSLTAELVIAYVANNPVPASELSGLITKIHASLVSLASSTPVKSTKAEPLARALVQKSITPDALVSFEDGKLYKTLKRHLTLRGLTPEAYREKYGLPVDYPMTAASYSVKRSELARSLGLGQQRKGQRKLAKAGEAETLQASEAKSKRAGRPGKAAAE